MALAARLNTCVSDTEKQRARVVQTVVERVVVWLEDCISKGQTRFNAGSDTSDTTEAAIFHLVDSYYQFVQPILLEGGVVVTRTNGARNDSYLTFTWNKQY